MLIYGTIVALCLLANVQARVAEPRLGRVRNRCDIHSWTRVSCEGVESPDALLPHPDDCNLFYYCVNPALPAVCRQCPAGLHFNPKSHVCDWPEQAGCRVRTTTDGTTGWPGDSTDPSDDPATNETETTYPYDDTTTTDGPTTIEYSTSTIYEETSTTTEGTTEEIYTTSS